MNILVTGGAGYIGSVTADHLLKAGHQVTVLDNLSKSHREVVPEMAEFVEGDIHDRALLQQLLPQGFDAVMHFAAFIEAGESMTDPDKYFDNNVFGSQVLFSEAVKAGINKIIFSSTAAVYETKDEPITEKDAIKPANVYGQTKRMIEEILYWYSQVKGIKVCIFRYFNAAGASIDRGENHSPETHIIPNILQVAQGKRDSFTLFGDDYPTPDGTCVRDYIHVDDLAEAHVLGLTALADEKFSYEVFNLGNGRGFSNKEVIETARKITGHPIPVQISQRRPGDAARLIAASDHVKEVLGWEPKNADLETIIRSAWEWQNRS